MSIYNTYLSNLDSLVFDTPNEIVQTDKDIAEELDLWSNAQFTYDMTPGVGIQKEEETKKTEELDSATYQSLVNYLDYELPSRPEVTQQPLKQSRILPRPLAPALPVTVAQQQQPVLIPSKPLMNVNPLPTIIPKQTTAGTKRKQTTDDVSPEEDKRRRNTAASARFRIKKKLREQAMEQSVQEMTLKSEKLQERVNYLEAEIKFLRGLLLDKTSSTN